MTRNRFCWTWGVLAFGLSTGLLFAVVMTITEDRPFLPWLAISLPLFGAGGYFWGRCMWPFSGHARSPGGQPAADLPVADPGEGR